MAQYNDLSREYKLLANKLYSAAVEAVFPANGRLEMSSETGSRLMQAMVDEVAGVAKQNDPEHQEFLRLQKKFPKG